MPAAAFVAGHAFFGTPAGLCGLAWDDRGAVLAGQLPEADEALTRQRLAARLPGLAEDVHGVS